MPSFVDTQGDEWRVTLNVRQLALVRDTLGVDLLSEAAVAEVEDPCRAVSVLHVLLADQILDRELSPEQFAERFAGDVIEQATRALEEALIAFCPSRRRPLVQAAVAKKHQLAEAAVRQGLAKLETLDAERVVREALSHLGDSFGTSPGSPVSTPGP